VGLLTLKKSIKYGQSILKLLKAVWAPKQVAVLHYQGHQKGEKTAGQENQKADTKAT
jgi:hypothetical protein